MLGIPFQLEIDFLLAPLRSWIFTLHSSLAAFMQGSIGAGNRSGTGQLQQVNI